jgi:transcriptional regulator with XRE-family HTH domain
LCQAFFQIKIIDVVNLFWYTIAILDKGVNNLETIGDRIKLLRQRFELRQPEFGARIGLTAPGVSKIETSKSQPSDAVLLLICNNFNVRREWLENGSGEMFESADSNSDYIDKLVRQYNQGGIFRDFLEMYMDLSAEHRALMDKFVETAFEKYQSRQNGASQPAPQSEYNYDIMSEDDEELTNALLERLEQQNKKSPA